ncbi:hypothetical protein GCM10022393_06950 [Aquimarina addita]|uniref:WG repeat-containing protein n=1 Tax=Aquimarina addita TaxID=870485 RepID=A0ABP7XB38_9FLAO
MIYHIKKCLFIIPILCCFITFSYSQTPFYNGSAWGFVDKAGTILIAPSYDLLPLNFTFINDDPIYKVVIKDTVFLIDKNQRTILSGYKDYKTLHTPFIQVKENNKFGIYNISTKKIVAPSKYDALKHISDRNQPTLFIAEINGNKSILDKKGVPLIPWDRYKKIDLENFKNKTYIIARFSGDNFLVYDLKGNKTENFAVSSGIEGEFIGLYEDNNDKYILKNIGNHTYEVYDTYNRAIFKTKVSSEILLDDLLFTTHALSERFAMIALTTSDDKKGLFDLLYQEIILEPIYDSLDVLNTLDNIIVVEKEGLYGALFFTEKEDPDYNANHIVANVTPIIFSKIEKVGSYFRKNILYQLPNGYKCFSYYDKNTGQLKYYLPKEILLEYGL